MTNLPELIAAFTFFGAFVVCPLVYMLMRHQRSIAELIHRDGNPEVLHRLERMESEIRALKAADTVRILADDDAKPLSQRLP